MAFKVVREFEQAVADFAGSRFAVATATGTWALFLSMRYCLSEQWAKNHGAEVILPARTFISVPQACLQAGVKVRFEDFDWNGVYRLSPYPVTDGALRFRKGMYEGGLHCLSFQARKTLNIGEGGMILTDAEQSADWLRAASYCGRKAPDYAVEDVSQEGYLAYMTPAKAAYGLQLMLWANPDEPDQNITYPDLRKVPYFARTLREAA